MARPRKHDGRLFRKEESRFWWMEYRDREGERQRESTNTEDWDEAQKKLRERLQARDNNTLPLLRKGERITFAQWADHFLEAFSKPPYPGREDAPVIYESVRSISKPDLGRSRWSI